MSTSRAKFISCSISIKNLVVFHCQFSSFAMTEYLFMIHHVCWGLLSHWTADLSFLCKQWLLRSNLHFVWQSARGVHRWRSPTILFFFPTLVACLIQQSPNQAAVGFQFSCSKIPSSNYDVFALFPLLNNFNVPSSAGAFLIEVCNGWEFSPLLWFIIFLDSGWSPTLLIS
jgi:hypothetical protein